MDHAHRRVATRSSRSWSPRAGTGRRVSLIYNGVDLERYDHQEPCCTLREEYGMDADAEIVGVVGRLELEKGHPTLLEAWPLVLDAACPAPTC